jgi:hypothetical protein
MTAQSKVYSGKRGRFSNAVEVRERGSLITRPLELRLDLFNHSPTEWATAAPARRNWRLRSSPITSATMRRPCAGTRSSNGRSSRNSIAPSGGYRRGTSTAGSVSGQASVDRYADDRARHLALVILADGTEEVRTLDKMRRAMGAATFVTLASIQLSLRPLTRAQVANSTNTGCDVARPQT